MHNKVYDVTKFLNEHPGGKEVLLNNTDQDATEAFEAVEHTMAANEIMLKYYIGDLRARNYKNIEDIQKMYVKLIATAILVFIIAIIIKKIV